MRREIVFDVVLIAALAISLTIPWYAKAAWNGQVFLALTIVGAVPVVISATKALWKRRISIDLLASVALFFAFISGEWYSAVFINMMLAFARLFDAWTEERTKRILSQLMKYLPEKVQLKRGENVVEVNLAEVRVGDVVIIETGERIPIDGTVISGQASINESTLTGESELVVRKEGDMVYSSTLNEQGSLLVKAEKVGEDSRLQKMAALVEEAGRRKAKSEMVADKFAQIYVFGMLAFAIFGYFFWSNKQEVLAILLVVCADDIAVAIPLTFTVAISRAARMGMILKGSEVIEKMAKLKYVVTDKTGTLTIGKPKVQEVLNWDDASHGGKSKFWEELAMTAGSSHHPVSRAIAEYAQSQGGEPISPAEFGEAPGEGTVVKNKGKVWYLGKEDYLIRQGVTMTGEQSKAIMGAVEEGFGISVFAENGKVIGLVKFVDEVKPEAKMAIAQTKELGVDKWWMLTGDNTKVAARVAREVGITQYQANLTPEEKIAMVAKIKKEHGGMVAMVGDGVNDAAALALADVSIAMGAIGSDAAIEAADVALVKDDLTRIPMAMQLGQEALKIMKQEFVIWGVTNAIGLALVLTGTMSPSWAAAYNFLTDFFPIMNALRLGTVKLRKLS